MDAKRPTPRHVIIKMSKVEDKQNLKTSKGKAVAPAEEFLTYRGVPISLSVS